MEENLAEVQQALERILCVVADSFSVETDEAFHDVNISAHH
jgi:hypothetical protein